MKTKNSAFGRQGGDLIRRQTGFVAKFLVTLYQLDPFVIDCCSVLRFIEARFLCALKASDWDPLQISSLQDQLEILIALFGLLTLLNQSVWGSNPAYIHRPNERDCTFFELLNTNALSKLRQSLTAASQCPSRMCLSGHTISAPVLRSTDCQSPQSEKNHMPIPSLLKL